MAKRYTESVDRDVYFEDVRLQMEAKLWGEEYNRHKPPKQVCGTVLATCPHQGSQRQCQEMRVMIVVPVTGFLLHYLNYSSSQQPPFIKHNGPGAMSCLFLKTECSGCLRWVGMFASHLQVGSNS